MKRLFVGCYDDSGRVYGGVRRARFGEFTGGFGLSLNGCVRGRASGGDYRG